jgi:hypothetical protein
MSRVNELQDKIDAVIDELKEFDAFVKDHTDESMYEIYHIVVEQALSKFMTVHYQDHFNDEDTQDVA